MLPLLARDFHRVSLAGPLSNIPAVILTGVIVPLGFLALLATIQWFAHWPRLTYRIPGPPAWLTVLFFAAFVALAIAARAAAMRKKAPGARLRLPDPITIGEWVVGIAVAVFALVVATCPFAPKLQDGKFEVSVLDVGQGDSIFVASPGGHMMLIDGGGQAGAEAISGARSGPDTGEDVVSPYLWSRGIKKLDVVALPMRITTTSMGCMPRWRIFRCASCGSGGTKRLRRLWRC
jgi:competence protein ComEC